MGEWVLDGRPQQIKRLGNGCHHRFSGKSGFCMKPGCGQHISATRENPDLLPGAAEGGSSPTELATDDSSGTPRR